VKHHTRAFTYVRRGISPSLSVEEDATEQNNTTKKSSHKCPVILADTCVKQRQKKNKKRKRGKKREQKKRTAESKKTTTRSFKPMPPSAPLARDPNTNPNLYPNTLRGSLSTQTSLHPIGPDNAIECRPTWPNLSSDQLPAQRDRPDWSHERLPMCPRNQSENAKESRN